MGKRALAQRQPCYGASPEFDPPSSSPQSATKPPNEMYRECTVAGAAVLGAASSS